MDNQQNTPIVNAPAEPVAEVMSVKDWLITQLIMLIPCVNFIMMFVWAFGSNQNPNKANYFKAYLIIYAVLAVISTIFGALFGGWIASIIASTM